MSKTHAETMLEKIEAVLEGRIDADVENYQIGGRSITKIPMSELIKLHSHYKGIVQSEQEADRIALGLGSKRKIKVRF